MKKKSVLLNAPITLVGMGSKTSFFLSNLILFMYYVLSDVLNTYVLLILALMPSIIVFIIGLVLFYMNRNKLIDKTIKGKKKIFKRFKGNIPKECPTCGYLVEEDEVIIKGKDRIKCPECGGMFKGTFERNELTLTGLGIGSIFSFFTANVYVIVRIILGEDLESSLLPLNGILPGILLIAIGIVLAFLNDSYIVTKVKKMMKLERLSKITKVIGKKIQEETGIPDECPHCGERLDVEKIEKVGKGKIECQYCGGIIKLDLVEEE